MISLFDNNEIVQNKESLINSAIVKAIVITTKAALSNKICTIKDQEIVTKVKNQIEIILEIADFFKLENFIRGLNMWLSGSGSADPQNALELSTEWIRDIEFVENGEYINEEKFLFEEIDKGPYKGNSLIKTVQKVMRDKTEQTFSHTNKFDKRRRDMYPYFATGNISIIDFILTVGSFSLLSEGKFEIRVNEAGDIITIKGEVSHKILELFDFNKNEKFPPDVMISLVILVPGLSSLENLQVNFDELNLLKKCDNAKDYYQKAEWKRSFIMSGPNVLDDLIKRKIPIDAWDDL